MVRPTSLLFAISVLTQLIPSHATSNGLAARQSFSPPSTCQSTCQVVYTMSNCGSDLSCLCANSIGSQLQQCMDCTVSASPSVEGEAQSAISGWNQACNGNLSLSAGSSSGGSTGGASGGGSAPNPLGINDATDLKTGSKAACTIAALIGVFITL